MIGGASSVMQSSKVRGALWLLAALPMIVGPALIDGGKPITVIGIVS